MSTARRRLRRMLARIPGALPLARLIVTTIGICLKYRVTGLAAEAGFFALLSLPPLVLGLFGGLGYLGRALGRETVVEVRTAIVSYASRFLTPEVINSVLGPTIDDVLDVGRLDLLSIGFLLSLWSGSRALNVFIDTISIMYGQSGVRGIVRTRTLSFTLYVVAVLLGVVTIPLVLVGPSLLGQILPTPWDNLIVLYWPLVTLLVVGGLTSLYHVATPQRSQWRRDVPGAVLTLVIWALASFAVRRGIAVSLGGTSIYGPLTAPIVLLIWLYALAIAVLIGAAFNAAIRELWPSPLIEPVGTRLRGWVETRRSNRSDEAEDGLAVPGAVASAGEREETDSLGLRALRAAAAAPLTPVRKMRQRRGSPAAEEVEPGVAERSGTTG